MFVGSSCKIAMALFVLLITMASLAAGASGSMYDVESINMQPCPFNQLCRCSRGGPEVGMIYCEDIPLGDVPNAINNTKSFALNLRRNGIRRIEEDLFHRTGKNHSANKCPFPPFYRKFGKILNCNFEYRCNKQDNNNNIKSNYSAQIQKFK